jgi:hypothetical protein
MARAGRSFEEGRIYHVYNRVGGGAKEFTDEELAATFVALLRLAMGRDGAAYRGGTHTKAGRCVCR